MTVRAKARLIFLAMFFGLFVCGALGGRLANWLGVPTLVFRNALAVICSYAGFLLMMGYYIRAVRRDRAFLSEAAAEVAKPEGKSSSDSWWPFDWTGDFDGWLIFIALVALVLLVGIWIGVEGPALLLDEASAAAIAAGLAGRTAFLLEPSWLRRVVTRTVIPVGLYLICTSIVMGYADVHCPGRLKFSQVVRECVMSPQPRAVQTNY